MANTIKYKPEYCDKLIDHMRQGKTYTSFAKLVKVRPATLIDWEREYPDFNNAKSEAFLLRKDFFEGKFVEIALGQDPNAKMAQPGMLIFMMKNINNWAEKNDVTQTTQGKIDYNITYEEIGDSSQIKRVDYEVVDNDIDNED